MHEHLLRRTYLLKISGGLGPKRNSFGSTLPIILGRNVHAPTRSNQYTFFFSLKHVLGKLKDWTFFREDMSFEWIFDPFLVSMTATTALLHKCESSTNLLIRFVSLVKTIFQPLTCWKLSQQFKIIITHGPFTCLLEESRPSSNGWNILFVQIVFSYLVYHFMVFISLPTLFQVVK